MPLPLTEGRQVLAPEAPMHNRMLTIPPCKHVVMRDGHTSCIGSRHRVLMLGFSLGLGPRNAYGLAAAFATSFGVVSI
jgi:hypothetical protein